MIALTWQVKAIIAGVLACGLLLGMWKVYESGKSAGRGEGSREQLDIDKKSMEQERSEFQTKLSEFESRDQQAQQMISEQQGLIDRATERLGVIQQQRQADQRQVAGVADSGLFADVTGKLNLRAPSDKTPNFTAPELRAIDLTITDYPKLRDAYGQLAERQAATDKKMEGLDARVTALAGERDAALTFANQMVGHYTAAYNAAQKRHSKWVTIASFGIVRNKKLDLPDPLTLAQPAPAKGK